MLINAEDSVEIDDETGKDVSEEDDHLLLNDLVPNFFLPKNGQAVLLYRLANMFDALTTILVILYRSLMIM